MDIGKRLGACAASPVLPLLLSTGHVCQSRKSITQAVEKYNLMLTLPTSVSVIGAQNMMMAAGFWSRMVSSARFHTL